MAEDSAAVDLVSFCASCGIAEVDDIELSECKSCDLVRYCSDECQREHKSKHEEAYKKRAAELRDELLFKQPESTHRGDCPICMIPLELDTTKSTVMSCCSKIICDGCAYANRIREKEASLIPSCPFCREPRPNTDEECNKRNMKRVEAGDPVAICQEGFEQCNKGDYISAFEYWSKAIEMGDVEAHFKLALLYHHGEGVERDLGKEIYHMEEAAIGGHPEARYNLGSEEWKNGNTERAVKHFIIAAKQGEDDSIKILLDVFKAGFVSKEDLADALRAHQAAVDATKSPQREEAHRFFNAEQMA